MNPASAKKGSKALNIKNISPKERPRVLLAELLEYPSDVPYLDRLKDLAIRYRAPYDNVYAMGYRGKWAERLAAVLNAKREQEEFERVFHSVAPIRADVPSSQVARGIKDLAFLLLGTAKKQVEAAAQMIGYYAERISQKIACAGGVGYLTDADTKEIEGWQSKIAYFAKSIEQFLRPGAITGLLDSISFTATVPLDMDGIDANAFTVARLQQTLFDLGMATAFGNAQIAEEAFSETNTGLAPEDLPEIVDVRYLGQERTRLPPPPNPD